MPKSLYLPVLVLLAACASPPEISQAYKYVQADGAPNYLLWLPRGYERSDGKYPLLLFLHGIGEKGNGSEKAIQNVSLHGPFRSMRDGTWDDSLPVIVAAPQFGGIAPWWPQDKILASLDHLLQTYRIDPSRVYLTGISMGGRAVWGFTEQHPERIAAVVPAGAWSDDLKEDCRQLHQLGVWAFHGKQDGLIKFKDGMKPVETLQACDPALEYPPVLTPLNAEHGSWELVYDNRHGGSQVGADGKNYDNIYQWLLTFSRTENNKES